jgi:integral membrane sensor domain MASE1/PAS domain-containing protein
MPLRTPASPLRLIILAVAYVAAARLGQSVAIEPGNVTAVWIPSGLAVGALVVWGVAMWPGVWIGAFAYNFTFYLLTGRIDRPEAMAVSLGIATGNTLMAISGSTLVELVRGTGEDLGRPRDALAYVGLAGLLSTTLSATIGTAVLLLGNVLTTARVGTVWATWWLGDASGVILVAPLLVLLGRVGAPVFPGKRRLLLAGSAVALASLLALVFGPWLPGRATTVLLALPIAFLSWTAFRLGRRVTMVTALLIGAVAVTATANGIGPLVGESLNDSLILLHCFLDTAAFTGLILATTVRASRRTEATPAPLPGIAPPVRSDLERQMELAIAQRRREENALADRVRALADEARTLERQLERRVAERDAVLAVLPDLFYVIDRATQRFTMTSEAFARDAAGLGRDDVLGRTIYDILPPALALRLAEQHREVFSTGDTLHIEESLPLPQGERVVDTLKAPFRGPDGEITGLVSTSRILSRTPRP